MRRLTFAVLSAIPLLLGNPALGAAPGGEVRVGIIPIADTLPLLVMEEEKSFPGLVLVPFKSALERDAALAAGEIDGCVMDPLAAAIMESRGFDVEIERVVLGATPAEGRFVLLAAPGSGITTVAQFAKVPVAVSSATIIEYVTDSLLTAGGVPEADIVKQEVKQIPIRFQMLMAGQVKGAVLPDPLAFLAEKQGALRVTDDTAGPANLSQVILVFSAKAMAGKRKEADGFLAAYDQAAARVNASPERYRPLLASRGGLPQPIATTYPVDRFPSGALADRASLEAVLRWAEGRKLLGRPVRFEELAGGAAAP